MRYVYLFSVRSTYISVHSFAKHTVVTPHTISYRTAAGHTYLIWKRRPFGLRCHVRW